MVHTNLLPARTLRAHEAPVRLIAFGPDGLMVTADVDMTTVVWKDERPVAKTNRRAVNPRFWPHDRMRSAAFSLDGSVLYLACGYRLIAVDPMSGDEIWSYRATEWWPFMISTPQSMAVDDEDSLVVSFDNGSFERWAPGFKRLYKARDHDAPYWLTIDDSAGKIVGCDGYHIGVWNLADGVRQSRFRLDDHVFAFAYSPRSGLAAVRDSGAVAVWNLFGTETGERVPVGPGLPLVAFNPAGTVLAYQNGPGVRLMGLDGRERERVHHEESRHVTLSFDRDGRLWTGHADGSVLCWEV